jgi:hypothetical protein
MQSNYVIASFTKHGRDLQVERLSNILTQHQEESETWKNVRNILLYLHSNPKICKKGLLFIANRGRMFPLKPDYNINEQFIHIGNGEVLEYSQKHFTETNYNEISILFSR